MGSIFSKNQEADVGALFNKIDIMEKHIHENIDKRLERIEERADINQDGIVTRAEMENYLANQLKSREEELIELKNKFKKERAKYKALKTKFEKIQDGILSENAGILTLPISTISKKRIQQYVDEVMETPEGNIDIIPDMIEKPLQVKKFKILLESIENLAKTASLDIAGHRIQMSIRPIE